jgi:hypothetical protein
MDSKKELVIHYNIINTYIQYQEIKINTKFTINDFKKYLLNEWKNGFCFEHIFIPFNDINMIKITLPDYNDKKLVRFSKKVNSGINLDIYGYCSKHSITNLYFEIEYPEIVKTINKKMIKYVENDKFFIAKFNHVDRDVTKEKLDRGRYYSRPMTSILPFKILNVHKQNDIFIGMNIRLLKKIRLTWGFSSAYEEQYVFLGNNGHFDPYEEVTMEDYSIIYNSCNFEHIGEYIINFLRNGYGRYETCAKLSYQLFDDIKDDDDIKCTICLDNNINIMFPDCQHCCVCNECVLGINNCPLCIVPFNNTIKLSNIREHINECKSMISIKYPGARSIR